MRINRRDLQLLSTVADYRVMTIRQVVALDERDLKTTQRRMSELAGAGLIVQSDRKARTGPGRPEKLISIAPGGFTVLRDTGAIRQDVMEEDVTLAGLPQVEHQLLLNWVRIEWMRIERLHPVLRVRFVAHSSPMAHPDQSNTDAGAEPVAVFIRLEGRDVLIPDAVATIADVERDKTVLFFLEIDMGTEPFDAPRKNRTTIVQKIQKYQRYFQAGQYRDYESLWSCSLRGFRVLFVTDTEARSAFLCRNLDRIRPREFIWVTHGQQLLEQGVSAFIWARGGRQDRCLESILGSRATGAQPAQAALASSDQAPRQQEVAPNPVSPGHA